MTRLRKSASKIKVAVSKTAFDLNYMLSTTEIKIKIMSEQFFVMI